MYSSFSRSSLINKIMRYGELHINKRFGSTESREVTKRSEYCLNSVQLLGRVATSPEQKGITKPIITFRLATDFNAARESGRYFKRTQWHKVICFDKELQNYVINNVRKGQRVYLQGHIEYKEFTDGRGNTKTETEIIAEDVVQEER